MDLEHPCLCVSDLDRAVEFYEALGFEHTHSFTLDGEENYYVGHPDGRGEIQLRYDPDRTTPIAPNRADVNHIAFSVDDFDAVFETAIEAGGSEVMAPTEIPEAGAYVTFVADPDGYTLEFFEHQ